VRWPPPGPLFLDEPTSETARARRRHDHGHHHRGIRSGGIAVIVEHDMDVVFTYCPGSSPCTRARSWDADQIGTTAGHRNLLGAQTV
jgi:hypothetical protein